MPPLLKKKDELRVDPGLPFSQDKLDRQRIADVLTPLVQSITQPFVIAVNSPFGTGKTSFLEMWKADLEIRKHRCVYLNAWKSDFASDPLIALIGELESALKRPGATGRPTKNASRAFKRMKTLGAAVAKKAAPVGIRLVTHGLVNLSDSDVSEMLAAGIGDVAEEVMKAQIDEYSSTKKSIEDFRLTLERFAEAVSKEPNTRLPLVVFVDELDRCRPTFAVELLERIKHVCNARGVVFVLSVNRDQLKHAVGALYGVGADADGYLRRFVDLEYRLPPATGRAYAQHLFDHLGIPQIPDLARFSSDVSGIVGLSGALFDLFGLTLRQLDQCFTELNVILRILPEDNPIEVDLLTILVVLRAFDETLYRDYAGGHTAKSVLERLTSRLSGDRVHPFMETRTGLRIQTILYMYSASRGEAKNFVAKADTDRTQAAAGTPEYKRANTILDFLPSTRGDVGEALAEHVRLVDLTAQFHFRDRE